MDPREGQGLVAGSVGEDEEGEEGEYDWEDPALCWATAYDKMHSKRCGGISR